MVISKGFASDNNSGVSPEAIKMISEVNSGHVVGYGDDPYTARAVELIKEHFGENAHPYFVFTGTAANVLGITASTRSFNSVLCAHTSHIHEDECGAPEKFSGCKLLPIDTENGKITPQSLMPHMVGFDFAHHSQPKIISISQPTEMGTVYSVEEIKELSIFAKKYGLLLHMDGARLANAAVSLHLPFDAFTSKAGVDILSFGGTKNGLLAAESIIFFDQDRKAEFKYIRKQGMQLASKMRYISAQFIAYLDGDLWKRNAVQANKMAKQLADQLREIKEVKITQAVDANGVFAQIPKHIIAPLKKEFFFYTWNEDKGEVRWMCSFDTSSNEINEFVRLLKSML